MGTVRELRSVPRGSGQSGDEPALDGEHPRVTVGDIANRPRLRGHVITLANEKGGVGKSTLAFHLCAALGDAGYRVAAIDLDRRQQTLARGLAMRSGTARRLGVALPTPAYAVLNQPSGAMLHQEIARLGWDCDFVVIDAPGHDCPIARRAIALANTLVSPVNSSFVDIDLLGRFEAATLRLKEVGYFARLVADISAERQIQGLPRTDWVVVPNRVRHGASHNQASIAAALEHLAPHAGFRLATGLSERVAYRELALLGLTHLDLKRIPQLGKGRPVAQQELHELVQDLRLPEPALEAELPMPV